MVNPYVMAVDKTDPFSDMFKFYYCSYLQEAYIKGLECERILSASLFKST